jgi:hypothetical protein
MRDRIISVFKEVAANQGRTLAPLSDDVKLAECGLDSLSFAIVVATLEDEFGIDPFGAGEWVDFPVNLEDFIQLYEDAAA